MPPVPVILLAFADHREGENFLKNVALENKAVNDALWALKHQGICLVEIIPSARPEDIIEYFNRYRDRVVIFHYCGHAEDGNLLLGFEQGEEIKIEANSLAGFLSTQNNLQLVFFNGCLTKSHGNALIEAGINSVIVTNELINDLSAKKFAQQFYQSLAAGYGISDSFSRASNGVRLSGGDWRSLYWEGMAPETEGLPWEIVLGNNGNEAWTLSTANLQVITFSSEVNDIKWFFSKKLVESRQNNIAFLIITSTLAESKSKFDFIDAEVLEAYYGEELEDWKPFKNESISTILMDIKKSTSVEFEMYVMALDSSVDYADDQLFAYIKYHKRKTILIIDPISIPENRFGIPAIFDDYHIGGCIISNPGEEVSDYLVHGFRHIPILYRDIRIQEKEHLEISVNNEMNFKNRIMQVIGNLSKVRRAEIAIDRSRLNTLGNAHLS